METVRKFEDLEVWQKSQLLCQRVSELMQKETFNKALELDKTLNSQLKTLN